MQAGKLNRRLVFQTLTETIDASGGVVKSWANHFTKWAAIEPMNFGESYRFDQDLETITGVITVRYDAQTKLLNGSYRATYDNRVFELQGVATEYEGGRVIKIRYREVV